MYHRDFNYNIIHCMNKIHTYMYAIKSVMLILNVFLSTQCTLIESWFGEVSLH